MYLGIEIGGTKLQLGLGAGDGVLRGMWRTSVDVAAGAEGIRRQIVQAIPELLQQASLDRSQLLGIGIGFGGPVDDGALTVIKSHQIKGWDHFPLADWVAEATGLPAVLGNDADVAGLAEALFGAGRGLSPIYYITIGSGIGGGFIINGEIYRGTGKGAAEIGHLRIFDPKTKTIDVLENHASGWAIARAADLSTRYRSSPDTQPFWSTPQELAAMTAADVAKAASSGKLLALGILSNAWDALAEAICHIVALLCPRRIVIGGGVSLMGESLLFKPLRNKVAARVFVPFSYEFAIVPAALGEEVVVHGALALANKRLGSPGEPQA
jgi:glucokinase